MGVPIQEPSPPPPPPPVPALESQSESSSQESDEGEGTGWHSSEVSEEWDDPSEGGVLTLVFRAAEHGAEAEMSQLLSQLSVSVDTPGSDSDTALHLAALYGHVGCARLLLEHGARAAHADDDGAVPLHDAAAGGYSELAALLLDAAPECLNAADSDGDTPLHNAARGGDVGVVRLLLARGADVAKENNEGKTPAALAMEDTAAAQLLHEAAAAGVGGVAPQEPAE